MVKAVDRWVKKYEDRATVATEDYKYGIENPSRSPIEGAIAQRKSLEAKMRDPKTWDKWENALKFVGDEGWKKGCTEKGADRYPTGIRAGLSKYSDFASKFADHLEAGVSKVKAMPKITIDDSVKRAEAMIRHNASFTYKKGK